MCKLVRLFALRIYSNKFYAALVGASKCFAFLFFLLEWERERENANVCVRECCLEKMLAYLKAVAVISTVFSVVAIILEGKVIYS